MPIRTVVQMTVGKSGSGKTATRFARLISEEILPETDIIHISNFPYNRHVVATAVAAKTGKPALLYLDRLQQIPQDVLERWRKGESGPWQFFEGRPLQDCHIAIDEVHNFVGISHSEAHIAKWMSWLGEIRHQGATIEFLSQHEEKVARVLILEAGIFRRLVHSDERPDPFFHIPLGDWYELRAKLSGVYLACVWEQIGRMVGRKWVIETEKPFWLFPKYFDLYDSYSAPVAGGEKGKASAREFERRSFFGLLWWFIRRHKFPLLMRSWVFIVPIFLLLGGGGWAVGAAMGAVSGTLSSNIRAAIPGPASRPAAARPAVPPARVQAVGFRASGARPSGGPDYVPGPPPVVVVSPVSPVPDVPVRVVLVGDGYVMLAGGEVVRLGGRPVDCPALAGAVLVSVHPAGASVWSVPGATGLCTLRLGRDWMRSAAVGRSAGVYGR